MILSLLLLAALFVLIYYVPGRLFFEHFLGGEDSAPESLPFSFGLGVIIVNSPAVLIIGLLGLLGPYHLSRAMVMGVSLLWTLALAIVIMRRGRLASLLRVSRAWRGLRGLLWLLTALSFLFYLLAYDLEKLNQESCMVRAAGSILGDYMAPENAALNNVESELTAYQTDPHGPRRGDRNIFITHHDGQRLGPSILLAPFLALFGTFGFRIAFALQGLLLPGLGFCLGRNLFGRSWPAFATALVLTFNPYSMASHTIDENFLSAPFGVLAVVILLRARPAPFAAGAALSLFLAIRHVGVLFLPFVALFLWTRARIASLRPLGVLGRCLLGLAAFGAPCLVMHGFMLAHSGVLFEGAMARPPAPHSFFGLEFDLGVLLNWPFVPEPLRSPFTAYPPLVAFPLDLVRRLGFVGATLALLGCLELVRRGRHSALLLAGFFVPLFALLLVQSNWVEPNKMGVPGAFVAPLLVAVVGGIVFLTQSAITLPRRLAALAVCALVPVVFTTTVRNYEAEVDPRVYDTLPYYWQHLFSESLVEPPEEDPAYVRWDSERLRPSLWPSLAGAHRHPALIRLRLKQLLSELRRPWLPDYELSTGQLGIMLTVGPGHTLSPVSVLKAIARDERPGGLYPVTLYSGDTPEERLRRVELVLERSPVLSDAPITRSTSDTDTFRLEDERGIVIEGAPLEWAPRPMNIIVLRDRFGTVHVKYLPQFERKFSPPTWLELERIAWRDITDGRLALLLPDNTVLRLLELVTFAPTRAYERHAVVTPRGVWLSPSEPYSP